MDATIRDPYLRAELQRAIAEGADRAREWWSSFDATTFFAPIGEAWSPSDNVRHLIKTNRPVAGALRIPKLVLLLRFGPAFRSSRRFAEVVTAYHAALGGGLTAGRFAPKPLDRAPTAETQTQLIEELMSSFEAVAAALSSWSERQLDRVRLPHPGMGLLTTREMVLFTLFHNQHHEAGVARRLSERG